MKSRTWHLPDIGYLVSIDAGASSPARINNPLHSTSLLRIAGIENLQRAQELLRAFFQSLTDCERTHEELFWDARLLDLNYFRLNVESGFEDVGRYEASKVATSSTGTDRYLQKPEIGSSLSFCALHLLKGPADGLQAKHDVMTKENFESPSTKHATPQQQREHPHSPHIYIRLGLQHLETGPQIFSAINGWILSKFSIYDYKCT